MRRFGSSDDPWFRIGNFDVSTTAVVVGLGVISMFVWAAEGAGGPIFSRLILISSGFSLGSVLEGEVWRLVTWPIPNEPGFWNAFLLFVFFTLGSEVERLMGRKPFAWFLGLLTVVPAVLVTLVELLTSFDGSSHGLRFLWLGLLVAFAAQYPNARFVFGIPAWAVALFIAALDGLQILGLRDNYSLVLWVCVLAVGVVGIRSFGYAESLPQVPQLPLPSFMTGQAVAPSRGRRSQPRRRRRGRSKANLSVVTPIDHVAERQAEQEIDALLDQVAAEGLESLTKQQRKRLEEHSRNLRRRRDQQ